jgi:hypothetical protein
MSDRNSECPGQSSGSTRAVQDRLVAPSVKKSLRSSIGLSDFQPWDSDELATRVDSHRAPHGSTM